MSVSDTLAVRDEAVLAHLKLLQSVIQRMAANSASCKTWCVTLVSAVLVLVMGKSMAMYAYIVIVPCVLFWFLDAYYLALEQRFIGAYNTFVQKLHGEGVLASDLYVITPEKTSLLAYVTAAKSPSILPFYGVLAGLVVFARECLLQGVG